MGKNLSFQNFSREVWLAENVPLRHHCSQGIIQKLAKVTKFPFRLGDIDCHAEKNML